MKLLNTYVASLCLGIFSAYFYVYISLYIYLPVEQCYFKHYNVETHDVSLANFLYNLILENKIYSSWWERTTILCTLYHTLLKVFIYNQFDLYIPTFNQYFTLEQIITVEIVAKACNRYNGAAILILWGQIMSIAILTIWARGVGPRFRPDQLSDLTWKDLLLLLTGILCTTLILLQ